jgi:hypothetical protein
MHSRQGCRLRRPVFDGGQGTRGVVLHTGSVFKLELAFVLSAVVTGVLESSMVPLDMELGDVRIGERGAWLRC